MLMNLPVLVAQLFLPKDPDDAPASRAKAAASQIPALQFP
jgi:hypothetical protein